MANWPEPSPEIVEAIQKRAREDAAQAARESRERDERIKEAGLQPTARLSRALDERLYRKNLSRFIEDISNGQFSTTSEETPTTPEEAPAEKKKPRWKLW